MRVERLRVSAFGPEHVSTLADLRGLASTRLLRLPDELDAGIVADAICWALHGDGGEAGPRAEVEVELRAGDELFRIRRRGNGGAAGEVVAWRRTGLEDEAEEGEATARGDEQLATLLTSLGLAPAGVMRLSLTARASELGGGLSDAATLTAFLEGAAEALGIAEVEERLEDLLLEVEGEADLVRLRRADALAEASKLLGEEASASLTLEGLDERREEARLRLDAARSVVERLAGAAGRARELIVTAQARQVRLDALDRARVRLRAAESKQAQIGCLKRELERAETAAGLGRSEKKLTDRKSLKAQEARGRVLREAEEKRCGFLSQHEASAARLRQADREVEKTTGLRERLVELEDLEAVLSLLERTLSSLAASEAERKQQQARRAAADASLQDLSARANAAAGALDRARAALGDEGARRLEALRKSLLEAESQLHAVRRLLDVQDRRKQATKVHATTMIHLDRARRTHDSELRLLQRRLSGEGPPPDAEEIEQQRVSTASLESDVNRLEREQTEQEGAVQELGAEVLRLRHGLGSAAYLEPTDLEAATIALREELEEAGAPAETLARAEAESARLAEERSDLERELEESESRLHVSGAKEESERDLAAELETRVPPELRTRKALGRERRDAERSVEAIETEVAAAREALSKDADTLAALEDDCAAARDKHLEASAVVEKAHEELATVVREAGFRDISAYQDAKRDGSERKAATARLAELETELAEARTAFRELEGLTNVPVLREADRSELEHEEWERRQTERKQRLQAERVHRDRDLLEGLLEQLESEHEAAREEEVNLAAGWEAIERASSATSGFAETLRRLRTRHQSLSRMTDLAAGRLGPSGGFAAFVRDGVADEAAARAGQWCRKLSEGELHLAVDRGAGGWSLELREVHGRRRQGAAGMSPEERWLSGLCLALGRGEAALLLAGAGSPLSLVVDRLPSGAGPAAQARVARWLDRLEETGRWTFSGVDRAEASEDLPLLERRGRIAADKAL